MSERPILDIPQSRELLEGLLTLPGSVGETYNRFHRYSPRNVGYLALQRCPPEPVATYKKWGELGRHVLRGSKAFSILRPIQIKVETEDNNHDEEFKLVRRFKIVRALFAASQTAGDDLPPYEHPEWSVDRALKELGIQRVPFESYDGNTGGYAAGNTIAINPVAPYPLRTTIHEASHVAHGDTTPENLLNYRAHRGAFEFRAEASAYVVLNELGALDEQTASVSRGYIQSWMRDQTPPEDDFRGVVNVSTKILDAGYEPSKEDE